MVASVSSENKLDSAPPSLVPATTSSSPATTPSRTDKTPSSFKRTPPNSRTKKKRIHPEQVQVTSSSNDNAPTHELFGDYMSIEEIAAQTEKAYQSRKKSSTGSITQSSCSSPARTVPSSISTRNGTASPRKGGGSPRRIKATPKVQMANSTAVSHIKPRNYAKIMSTLFMVTVILPFLICETFLLVLTLHHTIDISTMHSHIDIQPGNLAESNVLYDNEVNMVNENHIANNNHDDEEPDQSSRSIELEEVFPETMPKQHVEQEVDHMPGDEPNPEEITLPSESETIINQPKVDPMLEEEAPSDEPETRRTQTNDDPTFEYQMILKEAFHLIAAARSLSSATEVDNRPISNSETLCRQVLSRSQEMMSQLNQTENASEETAFSDPWETLFFQSKLCIGMVKISLSDNYLMLREAKQEFQHLSTINPYNLEARAGLGSSILAQGILYPSNNSTSAGDNDNSEQTALLTLAAFHLKLASSLCVTHHKPEGELAKTVSNIIETNHNVAHAAILHNLALAYIALGDSNSSTPVLLRAAAIHRRNVEYSTEKKTNIFLLWNLPNNVLHLVEEKAWLLGVKSAAADVGKKKKRRIPFVPESFTLDDMVDGM